MLYPGINGSLQLNSHDSADSLVKGVLSALRSGLKPIELFTSASIQKELLKGAGRTSLNNKLFILVAGLNQFHWSKYLQQIPQQSEVKYVFAARLHGALAPQSAKLSCDSATMAAILDFARLATSFGGVGLGIHPGSQVKSLLEYMGLHYQLGQTKV